jgi:hypothetical protein
MQHERVGIGPKLGNNKRHTMLHKPADVVDVAAKPIELGDDDVSLRPFGALDGLYQLGSMILAAALDFRQVSRKAKLLASANRCSASCWASRPRPERPCLAVETRM